MLKAFSNIENKVMVIGNRKNKYFLGMMAVIVGIVRSNTKPNIAKCNDKKKFMFKTLYKGAHVSMSGLSMNVPEIYNICFIVKTIDTISAASQTISNL